MNFPKISCSYCGEDLNSKYQCNLSPDHNVVICEDCSPDTKAVDRQEIRYDLQSPSVSISIHDGDKIVFIGFDSALDSSFGDYFRNQLVMFNVKKTGLILSINEEQIGCISYQDIYTCLVFGEIKELSLKNGARISFSCFFKRDWRFETCEKTYTFNLKNHIVYLELLLRNFGDLQPEKINKDIIAKYIEEDIVIFQGEEKIDLIAYKELSTAMPYDVVSSISRHYALRKIVIAK